MDRAVSRMGLLWVVALGVAASGCDKSRYVAVEMNMDADLRAVITVPSTGQKQIVLLGRDEPFEYPLKDLFARGGQSVRVAVVSFSVASITAALPSLQNPTVAQLKATITPTFGTPGPGAYQIPTPLRILTGKLVQGGSTDIAYQEMTLTDFENDTDLRFTFGVDAAIVCAPGANALRIFAASDPGVVCSFQRDAGCAWQTVPQGHCPNLAKIFGLAIDPSTSFRQVPPGMLIDDRGQISCRIVSGSRSGESYRFDCSSSSGQVVSVQETAQAVSNAPWLPIVAAPGGKLVRKDGVFATSDKGSLYAYSDGIQWVSLQRFYAQTTQVEAQDIMSIYGPQSSGVSRIDLGWIGAPRRLTTNQTHDHVVISGDLGAAVMLLDTTANVEPDQALAFYKQATQIDVVPSAMRTGDIIQGPADAIYALVETGIARLSLSGGTVTVGSQTMAGAIPSIDRSLSPQIVAVKGSMGDRIVVWLSDGSVIVFDSDGTPQLMCQLQGTILTVYDGPTLVRRNPMGRFTIDTIDLAHAESVKSCDPSSLMEKTYLVPANRPDVLPTTDITMDTNAYETSNNRQLLTYRYERDVGTLDLGAGDSQAIPIGRHVALSVLFEDLGRSTVWGIFTSSTALDFASINFPILKVHP